MSFSTVHDSRNKSLGRASFDKVETKRTGLKLDTQMMPPIVDFSSSEIKQSEWDGITCVHDSLRMTSTWNYLKTTMGNFKLEHSRFKENEKLYRHVTATVCYLLLVFFYYFSNSILFSYYLLIKKCCSISACGNYCLIGYSSGHVDLFNMQSGLFRGSYGNPSGK